MKLRETNVARLSSRPFDVLVVGGGINGAVAAACLAARGAKVALIDKGDFASSTSQESSNLAWGGIKYLETLEVGLVRKLCLSRNHLVRSYPSTVQEIRFYVTLARGFRHGRWALFLGTLFYWLLGGLATRAPRLLGTRQMGDDEPALLLDESQGGVEYSDAYLHDNDARFVWNFIRSALDHGAACANYVESTAARRGGAGWLVDARDLSTGAALTVEARVLVNACGPLVDRYNEVVGQQTAHRHLLSKGIHLIVPRVSKNHRVLSFFADDGRLFFVIPMGPRTCIGTTDTRVDDPGVRITSDDRRFVLDNINKRLRLPRPLTEADVIAERCGVRPLAVPRGASSGKDFLQLSRKHALDVDRDARHVSVFGGKLTDCLNVGEEIASTVASMGVSLPHPARRWYGEPGDDVRDEFFHQARLMELDALTSPSSSEQLSTRLWRRYAAAALPMLEEIRRDPAMAELLIEGAEYVRCEIEHAARREMIERLDDFLRRRSKIALVTRRDDILSAPGLREACEILFGDDAEARLAEYREATRAAGA
ncbi:MAG: FAD-dependent oxidoreductase [Polyangiaceae bacterium]|nr:FAD-dependent oxidoreductase [Polyangiaceae bacterium]